MGSWMRRPDIKIHNLGVDILHGRLIQPFLLQPGLDLCFQTIGFVADLPLLDRIIFSQRVALKLPMIQNPAQIGMPLKNNTVLIVGFALAPIGRSPKMGGCRDTDCRVGHRHPHHGNHVFFPVAERIHNKETGFLRDRIL